jgi:inosose dehydratase
MSIQVGCQTYTWQMSGRYDGRLDHILGVASRAGFAGVEPETRFLGPLVDPGRLAAALAAAGLALPAIALVEDWTGTDETPDERARADQCIALLRHFPTTLLNLCPLPGEDRANLASRQRNILACVNAVAARAAAAGLAVGVHPNSFAGSAFRTEADYRILFDGLDSRIAGYIPDAGHIARGGMDPLAVIRRYRALVRHVHFKDMAAAGSWASMGAGIIDFPAITRYLVASGYDGWLIVEDECDAAEHDPDGTTVLDGRYMRDVILPLTRPDSLR